MNTTAQHVATLVRAELAARRATHAAGARNLRQLADAIGVNRSTLRVAFSVGPLSTALAKRCLEHLGLPLESVEPDPPKAD